MKYNHLGRSGLRVSALSYGAWVTFGSQMDETMAARCMHAAFDAGATFFDNAEAYADGLAETIMGSVLANAGWSRSDYVVSTKIFWGGTGPNRSGLSRKHILEGTDAALRRLRLDYVDLVFCHRYDVHTPVEEVVRAMDHLVTSGRALYWGTSEWPAARVVDAFHIARRERLTPPVMEQPQYNMLHRDRVEREYVPLYDRFGLGITTWSPLAGGVLTGKYGAGIPEDSRGAVPGYEWLRSGFVDDEARAAKISALARVATELGCSLAQLAIAWCLKNPRVSTVITGASRPEQVVENMAAVNVADQLTVDVMARIESILDNRPEPEKDWRAV